MWKIMMTGLMRLERLIVSAPRLRLLHQTFLIKKQCIMYKARDIKINDSEPLHSIDLQPSSQ